MFPAADSLLLSLVKASGMLAVTALAIQGLIWRLRPASARLQRLAWLGVLLQGILLVQWPVGIPWSGPRESENAAVAPSPMEPIMMPEAAPELAASAEPAGLLPAVVSPARSARWNWPAVALFVWLAGFVGLVGHAVWSYVRFVRRLVFLDDPNGRWQAEWTRLLAQTGVRRPIPLRVTAQAGPAMCLLPSGYHVLVPKDTWLAFSAEERLAVLRHELAHYEQGDVWRSLGASLLTFLHWLNPLAWLAFSRLETCGEWLCDQRAAEQVGPADYARALMQLGGGHLQTVPQGNCGHTGRLFLRIRRVLVPRPHRDSTLTKLALAGSVAVLLALGLVRLELVAHGEEKPDESATFRLYDGFDGKLALDWQILRPNPQTASLTKHPGRLTITSEHGGLHAENYTGMTAKNVYLLPNPADGDGDFVVTTCLEGFHPEEPYQQAGPHIYDDDNNYINTVVACNESGVVVSSAWEINGVFAGQNLNIPDLKWERLWLRIIKRGAWYESAYSTDGKTYTVFAEQAWGSGTPKQVGLAVMNGNGTTSGLDAAFDFFEVRSLTAAEKSDPVHLERQKLQGIWEVVSCQIDGQPMAESASSRFVFRGLEMTFAVQGASIKAQYTLDTSKNPKELRFRRGHPGTSDTTAAVYRMDQDRLVLCMNLHPNEPAPTAFETKPDDGRLLVTLRKMPAAKAAMIQLASQFRMNRFRIRDTDRDGFLTRKEFLVDYPEPEGTARGTELLKLLDVDHDERLSVDEFRKPSPKVLFLEMDADGDGVASADEFLTAEAHATSPRQAKQTLARIDQNGDEQVSVEEYSKNYAAIAFSRADRDGDDRIALADFATIYPQWNAPVQSKAFDAIDRNGDGVLRFEEYQRGVGFLTFFVRDRNQDGHLSWEEYSVWSKTPEALATSKQEFAKRDLDANGQLTFEEAFASPEEITTRQRKDK
jgi:uncharacterized protein (TIGR03067 family)